MKWRDIKQYMPLFEITFNKMYQKFYPHFVGYEDDLKQEMMIALVGAVRRIKKDEIRSIRNYIITALKYAAFKYGRIRIAQDKSQKYLEDLNEQYGFVPYTEWEEYLDCGILTYEIILLNFTTFEERYIGLCLFKAPGYSRRALRRELRCSWEYIAALEDKVKTKLVELIKTKEFEEWLRK